MDGATKTTVIPLLKASNGQWIHEAKEKANAFANMLSNKFVLPADVHHEVIDHRATAPQMNGFILIRERWVRRELKALRLDHASGPDEIPARLLIELRPCLVNRCATFCEA